MLRAIFVVAVIGSIALFSAFLAHFTVNSDFPVYYHAAKTVLDPTCDNNAVYIINTTNKFSIPERLQSYAFIYSIAAAYLVAPLALLSYYTAKAVLIFLNCIAYLAAITIIVRINAASGRLLFYPLILSLLWFPFLQDLRSGQINSLLLLLVSSAVFSAIRQRPYLCGTLLAIAALFKLFLIPIAMVLGLRNWRILASCLLFISVALLIPGSLDWFAAMGNIHKNYSPVYRYLISHGTVWFYAYVMIIAGIAALLSHRCKEENHPLIVSFAIPAVLLIMPIIEYYHYTLLMFSVAYLITSEYRTDVILMRSIAVSATLINLAIFFTGASVHFDSNPYLSNTLLLLGVFIMWTSLAYKLYRCPARCLADKAVEMDV